MKRTKKKVMKLKFEQGHLFSDRCPSRQILKHVTSQWGVLILVALSEGEIKRFSELRRQLSGVSEKMLSQNLKQLESDGFIIRTSYNVVPPYVEYSLSELGLEIAERVTYLTEWIEENLLKIMENQRNLD